MTLVAELKLETSEIEAAKNRLASMLVIYRTGRWQADDVKTHFSEWENIAQRIKRGGEMLDSMTTVREASNEHAEKIQSLYTFLMKLLGMYDAFFKYMLQKDPTAYDSAREKVIALTK